MELPIDPRRYGDVATLLLRVALGSLFAYFGILAVIDPAETAYWLAAWVPALFTTPAFLIPFGVFQLAIAASLILGLWVRIGALAAAFALLGIVVNLGLNEIAYRDLTLMTAALVLATRDSYRWALRP